MSKAVEVVPNPNSTPSYYSVQFHVYRLLIAPSIIDNLIVQCTLYNVQCTLYSAYSNVLCSIKSV